MNNKIFLIYRFIINKQTQLCIFSRPKLYGKMEEDVKPKDEDGVDGRGVYGWDGWVCGLGPVGVSSIVGSHATSSSERFLHNLRRWSTVPWRGFRLWVLAWVSVGPLSHLDHVLDHHIRVMGGCDLGVVGTPLIFGLGLSWGTVDFCFSFRISPCAT